MKLTGLKPTTVRKILFLALFLVIGLAVGGFYLGLQQIRSVAVEVSRTTEDATASGKQVEQLRELQVQLEKTRTLVEKADKIAVSSSSYQSQALKDLSKYAATAGISLTSTDFPGGNGQIKIAFTQPVSYAKLLYFLELIEGNLPNMQLAGITVSRPENPTGDSVNVTDITLKVLTR